MMKNILLFGVGLVLAACAPAIQSSRVKVETLFSTRSFYPHEAGLMWEYLEPGERADTPRLTKEVLGPTRIDGQVLVLTRFYGRGQDTRSFERYGADGVFLVREDKPGATFVYDPPMQTLPSQKYLKVGSTWQGSSTVNVFYPNTPDYSEPVTIDYNYQVIDQRHVKVADTIFPVFVISLQATQTTEFGGGQNVAQEIWYTPYVGEVKTKSNIFLADTNFDVTSNSQIAQTK
jgi:hypothetical protein